MEYKYDKASPESILEYALGIAGKSLSEVVDSANLATDIRHKGNLGRLIELHYFRHDPGNGHGPDFPEAGVELKTTGVVRRDGKFVAKERLVLSMIDYVGLVAEAWATASLMDKCRLMLILFYLYEKGVAPIDRKFVLNPLLFEFPSEDLAIIRRDWETIQRKVREGKAHELSEGDTFYLGACRKGSGGADEPLRKQPYSSVKAKARAFSLKPSYVNQIIAGFTTEPGVLEISENTSFEEATYQRFERFLGKSVDELARIVGLHRTGAQKAFKTDLIRKLLGASGKRVPEFEKAEVEIKTIVLNPNGNSKEAMSFPNFRYTEIVNETWEETSFAEKLERKFFFVIFRRSPNGEEILERVAFWNMPFNDREEARAVWEETKKRVGAGDYSLPRSTDSRVAHVRTKGRDSADMYPTPQGGYERKRCFWLNAKYITNEVNRLARNAKQ